MIKVALGAHWHPLHTTHQHRPDPGQLLAYQHAVWRVARIEDTPLSDTDREVWIRHKMPDLATWGARPYKITLEWVAGAEPPWTARSKARTGTLHIPSGRAASWRVYKDGRWPQCSCCGEPMPCRAELQDQQVAAGLDRIARLEAIPAGACWACSEPVTRRQGAVTYPGDNLDLPGGQEPTFHTRDKCVHSAIEYEERWLAADPRRERILTWPDCGGILLVHADGSSECVSGRGPLGVQHESQPDCRGHDTHDHTVKAACCAYDRWLDPHEWEDACCPRGCKLEDHGGATPRPRPKRRQPSVGGLF